MRHAILASLVLCLWGSPDARADTAARSHVSEAAPLTLPDGSSGRIEVLHGDGFIGAGLVRVQIRNAAGGVLAWTPADVAAVFACPDASAPEACRAFVFGQAPWPRIWVPDPAGFEPDARPVPPPRPGEWTGPFPGFEGRPGPVGFREVASVSGQLHGLALLVGTFWRGLLFSVALIAGAVALLGRAVRATRPGWKVALWAAAVGAFVAAGFQAVVLVLLIGLPAGVLGVVWGLGAAGWVAVGALRWRR